VGPWSPPPPRRKPGPGWGPIEGRLTSPPGAGGRAALTERRPGLRWVSAAGQPAAGDPNVDGLGPGLFRVVPPHSPGAAGTSVITGLFEVRPSKATMIRVLLFFGGRHRDRVGGPPPPPASVINPEGARWPAARVGPKPGRRRSFDLSLDPGGEFALTDAGCSSQMPTRAPSWSTGLALNRLLDTSCRIV